MNGVSLAAEMADAADSWLRSLSADQRDVAQYPGPDHDDPERTRWFYTPTDHGGLTLNEQRPGQQQLAMRLLSAGLSLEGYALAAIVMSLENIQDRLESWTRDWGRERGRDRTGVEGTYEAAGDHAGSSGRRATAPGGGGAAATTSR